MSEQTKIEWADGTWNPWIGCTKVSDGCKFCYAEALNARFHGGANWGKGKPRRRTKDWSKPRLWNRAPRLAPGTPRPRIFPSMCDWLDDEVPIEWLADFLKLIHDTPELDWMMLTKRPEKFHERVTRASMQGTVLSDVYRFGSRWLNGSPPSNVWIGTSVEDQPRADERIPELLKIPARVRFLSVEPMLGPVDLLFPTFNGADSLQSMAGISWVIAGGESGRGARPCNIQWIRDIVWQCANAGVPCFVKQLGSFSIHEEGSTRRRTLWDDPKGGDPAEWPADLRVRQFPEVKL